MNIKRFDIHRRDGALLLEFQGSDDLADKLVRACVSIINDAPANRKSGFTKLVQEPGRRGYRRIPLEQLRDAWEAAGGDAGKCAESLGISKGALNTRISRHRKAGQWDEKPKLVAVGKEVKTNAKT